MVQPPSKVSSETEPTLSERSPSPTGTESLIDLGPVSTSPVNGDRGRGGDLPTTGAIYSRGQFDGLTSDDDEASESDCDSIFAFKVPRGMVLHESTGSEYVGAERPTPASKSPAISTPSLTRAATDVNAPSGMSQDPGSEYTDETGESDFKDNNSVSDMADNSGISLIEEFIASTALKPPLSPQVCSVLSRVIDRTVDRITSKLRSMIVHSPNHHGARHHPYAISPSNLSQASGSRGGPNGSRMWSRGRQVGEENDQNSGRDDDDDENNNRWGSSSGLGNPKFTCPFFKKYPENVKLAGSCYGPGWPDVHRVKQHLKRSHVKPQHLCHRCQRVFKSDADLSRHLQQQIVCDQREPLRTDDRFMSEHQYAELRKLRGMRELSQEQRWFRVYEALFGELEVPRDQLGDFPYHQDVTGPDLPTVLHRFEAFLVREIPERISDRISRDVGQALPQIRAMGINIDTIIAQACQDNVKHATDKFMSTQCPTPQHLSKAQTSAFEAAASIEVPSQPQSQSQFSSKPQSYEPSGEKSLNDMEVLSNTVFSPPSATSAHANLLPLANVNGPSYDFNSLPRTSMYLPGGGHNNPAPLAYNPSVSGQGTFCTCATCQAGWSGFILQGE